MHVELGPLQVVGFRQAVLASFRTCRRSGSGSGTLGTPHHRGQLEPHLHRHPIVETQVRVRFVDPLALRLDYNPLLRLC